MNGGARGRDHVHEVARRLRSRCEAIFGAVFVTPEATEGGHGLNRTQWYMAGRAAPLGAVGAEVAGSVFGTIAPRLVRAGMDGVWSLITPTKAADLKLESAVAVLAGVIPTARPELDRAVALLSHALDAGETAGHPLFAGLSTFPKPSSALGYLWRMCDMMREHRSDAHVTAWRSFGFDPVEINVLNELWRDVPIGSITTVNMGWGLSHIDAARARLIEQGLATDVAITPEGRAVRDDVERVTSAQQASIVDALGDDSDELLGLLDPWARTVAAL